MNDNGRCDVLSLRVSRRLPQGAERECELRWRLQVQPRELREAVERRQLPPCLLLLICFSSIQKMGEFLFRFIFIVFLEYLFSNHPAYDQLHQGVESFFRIVYDQQFSVPMPFAKRILVSHSSH